MSPSRSTGQSTVHPRAGGEHARAGSRTVCFIGSSPRGRGTRQPRLARRPRHRFIPARAGNTARRNPAGGCRPVSSPRGRGTLLRRDAHALEGRFIPARAGNTSPASAPGRPSAVHPRAGGEHVQVRGQGKACSGSSPRGRGTREVVLPVLGCSRFIPARAGNTARAGSPGGSSPVHPRAGGEHSSTATSRRPCSGSSPRGRGTLPGLTGHSGRRGGSSPRGRGTRIGATAHRGGRTVHPRAGGEHLGVHDCRFDGVRFIPARAGNTVSSARSPAR